MSRQVNRVYEFGEFRLETAERLLLRKGQPISLTPKAFETLLVLVQSTGHVVEKSDLMNRVWGETFVEEANLARNIWALRKALADDSNEHSYIETVPKLGYRFLAPVTELTDEDGGAVIQRRIRARIVREEISEESLATTPITPQPTQVVETTPHTSIQPVTRKLTRRNLLFGGVLLAALIVGIAVTGLRVRDARSHVTGKPVESLAVLPFANVSNNPELDYLSEGLTENLINRLSHASRLRIIAHNSVVRYRGKQVDAQKVGMELGVESVLVSRVEIHGEKLSVSSELVDCRNGTHIWGDRYERDIRDLQSLQSELTRDMAAALRLEFSGSEKTRLEKTSSKSPDAYQLYLKGRYFWNKRTLDGLKKGIECFEQAVRLDPNYALAYVGLADCYSALSQSGAFAPNEVMPKAKTAALSALNIDDTLAEAHASLALINELYDFNWRNADSEFKRAIELNPNYASAHHWYAMYLSAIGRHDEALTEINIAEALDPVSLITNTNEGWILFSARRYDQALEKLRATIEMDPNFANAHYKLGLVYEIKGMYKEAVEEHLKYETLAGLNPGAVERLRAAFAASGWKGFCRQKLEELKQSSSGGYTSPRDYALAYMRLGDADNTFRWLEEAYRERTEPLLYLKVDPRFDFVRSDPRFEDFLRRMALPK